MRLMIAAVVVALASCKATTTAQQTAAQPAVVVYKTKANYNNLVPVILSDDKSGIVSYPAPADLRTSTGYATPTVLHNGYLLDNRGVGKNTGFLKLTYEEYAAMESAPSLAEMYAMIVDKDPLTELYDCGSNASYKNKESELNAMIDGKELKKKCKKIK
ncbi:MAG: hypothetical protein K0R82_434 [Flavipsychrobacter sp.]|jgi:hypothetical protein|nr:hypothetical protein [Flavipsychrobacter sp.]